MPAAPTATTTTTKRAPATGDAAAANISVAADVAALCANFN